jgi:hypothetical protein
MSANTDLFHNGSSHKPSLLWTHRVMKSYFGKAFLHSGKNKIKINRILNSPEIDENEMLIDFVMYHEMLHFSLGKLHNAEFRRHEAKFPTSVDCDSILDRIRIKHNLDVRVD